MPTRRVTIHGLAALGLVPLLPAPARALDPAGAIETVAGTATAQMREQVRALEPGLAVFLGEQVRTGAESRARMALGGSTRLHLGAETRVRIDRHLVGRGGEIRLERGALLFDRPDEAPHEPARVRSPYALLVARGTRFFAGPSGGVFGVFVRSGVVDVVNRGGRVRLTEGHGTDIAAPGEAPTPPKAWGEARIRAALDSIR